MQQEASALNCLSYAIEITSSLALYTRLDNIALGYISISLSSNIRLLKHIDVKLTCILQLTICNKIAEANLRTKGYLNLLVWLLAHKIEKVKL